MDIQALHDTIHGYIAAGEVRGISLLDGLTVTDVDELGYFFIEREATHDSLNLCIHTRVYGNMLYQHIHYDSKQLYRFQLEWDDSYTPYHERFQVVQGSAFEGEHVGIQDEYVVGGETIRTLYSQSDGDSEEYHCLRLLRTPCDLYVPVDPGAFWQWLKGQRDGLFFT